MAFYVDLHIHTCLSACGDENMTPNNIVNMAKLKGLDVIAITDHNSARNCEAVMKCGEKIGLKVIPGIEVETSEEVHMICLFKSLEDAYLLENKIMLSLPKVKNPVDIFGHQLVMDEEDNVVCELENLLTTACGLSVYEIYDFCKNVNAVCYPAHVDRDSHSIISNLGFIPEDLDFSYVEVSNLEKIFGISLNKAQLDKYIKINSSDAHYLSQIFERTFKIEKLGDLI